MLRLVQADQAIAGKDQRSLPQGYLFTGSSATIVYTLLTTVKILLCSAAN